MNDILDQARKNFNEYEQNLYILKNSKCQDVSSIEKEVSAHLDEYITKHGKELMSLEIQKLFNIFSSDNLNLTKQDEAYQLIKNHYVNHKNDEIFILLCTLEGKKLNESNFRESILEAKERCGFQPTIELSFFDMINNSINQIKEENLKQANQINKLEEIVRNQQEQIKEQSNQIIQKNEEKNKRIIKLEEIVKQQASQIQEQKDQISQLVEEIQKLKENEKERQNHFDSILEKQKIQMNESIVEIKQKLKNLEQVEIKKQVIEQILKNKAIQCQFNGNETSGIFSYLTKKYGEKLINNGIISITGGGSLDPFYSITNIIKDDRSYYYNYRVESGLTGDDGYILFDFGNGKINLTSYTFRSEIGTSYPKTWEIIGSKNGVEWNVLNRQENDEFLKNGTNQHLYYCQKNNNYYKYIKIKQIESWGKHNSALCFGFVEFFGSILDL